MRWHAYAVHSKDLTILFNRSIILRGMLRWSKGLSCLFITKGWLLWSRIYKTKKIVHCPAVVRVQNYTSKAEVSCVVCALTPYKWHSKKNYYLYSRNYKLTKCKDFILILQFLVVLSTKNLMKQLFNFLKELNLDKLFVWFRI